MQPAKHTNYADIAKYAEYGMSAEGIEIVIGCNIISYTYIQTVMDQMFKQAA